MSKLGFVGVGLMGHGMASHLLAKGHEVTIIANRNRGPVDDLVSKGAREAKTLAELARGRDGVFICVATSEQVRQVVEGLLPGLSKGAVVIDTGTSDPNVTLELAAKLKAAGLTFMDAPMGGGAQHAARGELATMVGGSEADFARVQPWLAAYSKTVVRMGEVGAGHRAKLLNNLLALGQAALVVEAYRIARAEGIDWAKLFEVNMGGAAKSGSLERIIAPAIDGNFRGYLFTLENTVKDLSYFQALATKSGDTQVIGAALIRYFKDAAESRGGQTMVSELLTKAG
jgi:3-hydroxyisobutyrate dehydrogenase-like beta-hydroxyacid dehydrogenase